MRTRFPNQEDNTNAKGSYIGSPGIIVWEWPLRKRLFEDPGHDMVRRLQKLRELGGAGPSPVRSPEQSLEVLGVGGDTMDNMVQDRLHCHLLRNSFLFLL